MKRGEQAVPLKQVASLLPGMENQKPTYATVRRWCVKGVWSDRLGRTVKLESYFVGRRRMVPVRAIDQFLRDLNG